MRTCRDYQSACIEKVRDAYRSGRKAVAVELFTGAGKGYIIAAIAKMVIEKGGRVLVAVNRDNLCEQLFQSLVEQGMLPVMERGMDKASPLSDLVVGSIQTMQGERLRKWNRNHFRLVICDEVHFAAANTFKATLDYFADAFHLGLSATVERHDKKGLWKGYEEVVFSMPLTSGIEQGWLVPFEFEELPVPIVISDMQQKKKMWTEKDESEVFSTNDYLPRLFAEAASRVTDRRALFFWPNCDSSMEADRYFQSAGLNSRHVEGPGGPARMNRDGINELLEWFKEPGPKCLNNADLLSYGYDNPTIDTIGIMRLSRSIPMLKQRLGRGTRPCVPVDNYPTPGERRAAIAASVKPACKVLDLMLQLGEVQNKFADATALITEDDAEKRFIREEMKRAGKPLTMAEIEGKLVAKRQTDRDKQLARLAEDAANAALRKGAKAKEVYVGHILRRAPEPHWKEASHKQVNYLRKLGYNGVIDSAWHASRIIDLYIKHHENLQLT